ncbi:MAG: glycoside hydrolase family 19 protein [Candidatus Dactylopiibacterium sp.]|nr:glycoside hydrolase family 19 protein [Candidatus Dactylopiibacterium sp.]
MRNDHASFLSRPIAGALIALFVGSAHAAVPANPPAYDPAKVYGTSGTYVKFSQTDGTGRTRTATFSNAWWTQGAAPQFFPNDGPWKRVSAVVITDGSGHSAPEGVAAWNADASYGAGSLVKANENKCSKAKWWTKGDTPPATAPTNAWETPWELLACPTDASVADAPVDTSGGGIGNLPAVNTPDGQPSIPPSNIDTPVVPPVTPKPPAPPAEPQPAIPSNADGILPATGYAFLRQVTDDDWNWMFPLRSGRYNPEGGTRNNPPVAAANGSTDVFTLGAFRKAVLDYNTWASQHNYKQFLNEGTLKQQAQEFLTFWAKSSRETSGSWSGAPAPWVVPFTNAAGESTSVWKGGLYWVEEVGYSTRADGTSAAVNYVDPGSTEFPPVAGRSYYGRGIIQLSWNYNYGAFSYWLYDNGLRRDLITRRDTLLHRPDYVATDGALSILSGIWFWMTPQGAKPSSHDVLYGDVHNISASSTDRGLPQLRAGYTVGGKSTGPTAAGDTTDAGVLAFRFGTILNIVNGGLECNGAAAWHNGPPQRVSYYNAFTMYFNDRVKTLNATRIPQGTNIWESRVSASSPEQMQSATCFNQKSYYGW